MWTWRWSCATLHRRRAAASGRDGVDKTAQHGPHMTMWRTQQDVPGQHSYRDALIRLFLHLTNRFVKERACESWRLLAVAETGPRDSDTSAMTPQLGPSITCLERNNASSYLTYIPQLHGLPLCSFTGETRLLQVSAPDKAGSDGHIQLVNLVKIIRISERLLQVSLLDIAFGQIGRLDLQLLLRAGCFKLRL